MQFKSYHYIYAVKQHQLPDVAHGQMQHMFIMFYKLTTMQSAYEYILCHNCGIYPVLNGCI